MDVKHCHGYLGHEFLSAVVRDGKFGGSFENRTRFLREIVAGIRAEAPGLEIGVRLSAYDFIPFKRGKGRVGIPETLRVDGKLQTVNHGLPSWVWRRRLRRRHQLMEPHQFLGQLEALGIKSVTRWMSFIRKELKRSY